MMSEARRDQPGAEEYEPALPAPDEIDQVAERHLERPRHADPEAERGEEGGGEPEVILDEERADDAGQARDAVGDVHHQRREVGEPQLPPEGEDVEVNPAQRGGDHGAGIVPANLNYSTAKMPRNSKNGTAANRGQTQKPIDSRITIHGPFEPPRTPRHHVRRS